jgi:hypothetical protein
MPFTLSEFAPAGQGLRQCIVYGSKSEDIYRERDDMRLTGYQVGLLASSSSQSQIGRCRGLWLLTWNLLRLLLIHACRRPIEAAAPTSSPPDSNLRPLVPMSSYPQSRLSMRRWRYGSMAAYRDGELNCSQRKTVRGWRCAPLRQGSCRPIRAVLDSIWARTKRGRSRGLIPAMKIWFVCGYQAGGRRRWRGTRRGCGGVGIQGRSSRGR